MILPKADYITLAAILTRRAKRYTKKADRAQQKAMGPDLIHHLHQEANWSLMTASRILRGLELIPVAPILLLDHIPSPEDIRRGSDAEMARVSAALNEAHRAMGPDRAVDLCTFPGCRRLAVAMNGFGKAGCYGHTLDPWWLGPQQTDGQTDPHPNNTQFVSTAPAAQESSQGVDPQLAAQCVDLLRRADDTIAAAGVTECRRSDYCYLPDGHDGDCHDLPF